MDRISRRSQGPEGVRFGDHTILSLLFAADGVMLAPSDQDLQYALLTVYTNVVCLLQLALSCC